MRAAGTAGVLGLMPAIMRAKAGRPPTDQSSPEQSRSLPEATESNKFNVFSINPKVVEPGGTITTVTGDNWPVLKGNQAAVFYLVMKPGAVREPHWDPDAWELDVPISGNGRLGVVNPNDTWSAQAIKPGSEIGFVPQGYAHYIENIGKTTYAGWWSSTRPTPTTSDCRRCSVACPPTRSLRLSVCRATAWLARPSRTKRYSSYSQHPFACALQARFISAWSCPSFWQRQTSGK